MFSKYKLPNKEQALPGRSEVMQINNQHTIKKTPLLPPYPAHLQQAMFGLGCFWGAEKIFWQADTYSTAVGYSGGFTANPTYQEICSGKTAHNEVVSIVFDQKHITYADLLDLFWHSHNPTQGFQQGNDKGTQYRSAIYYFNDAQQQQALQSKEHFQKRLNAANYNTITTEIIHAGHFYFAEDYHQQYLAKNPNGYCGLGGLAL